MQQSDLAPCFTSTQSVPAPGYDNSDNVCLDDTNWRDDVSTSEPLQLWQTQDVLIVVLM